MNKLLSFILLMSCSLILCSCGGESFTPYQVVSVYPESGSTVPNSIRYIKIELDRPLESFATLADAPFVMTNSRDEEIQGELTVAGKNILFILRENLAPSMEYRITVRPEFLATTSEYQWPFTEVVFHTESAADTRAPELVRTEPTSFSEDFDPLSPIILEFNEDINPGTLATSFTLVNQRTFEQKAYSSQVSGNVVTIIPSTQLDENSSYYLDINSNLTDSSANAFSPRRLVFKTSTRSWQMVEEIFRSDWKPLIEYLNLPDGSQVRLYTVVEGSVQHLYIQTKSATSTSFGPAEILYSPTGFMDGLEAVSDAAGNIVVAVIVRNGTNNTLFNLNKRATSTSWDSPSSVLSRTGTMSDLKLIQHSSGMKYLIWKSVSAGIETLYYTYGTESLNTAPYEVHALTAGQYFRFSSIVPTEATSARVDYSYFDGTRDQQYQFRINDLLPGLRSHLRSVDIPMVKTFQLSENRYGRFQVIGTDGSRSNRIGLWEIFEDGLEIYSEEYETLRTTDPLGQVFSAAQTDDGTVITLSLFGSTRAQAELSFWNATEGVFETRILPTSGARINMPILKVAENEFLVSFSINGNLHIINGNSTGEIQNSKTYANMNEEFEFPYNYVTDAFLNRVINPATPTQNRSVWNVLIFSTISYLLNPDYEVRGTYYIFHN